MHLKKVTLNPEKYPTRDHYPFNLMAYFKSRLKIKGLYILDEPETALLTFFIFLLQHRAHPLHALIFQRQK